MSAVSSNIHGVGSTDLHKTYTVVRYVSMYHLFNTVHSCAYVAVANATTIKVPESS